MVPQPRLQSGEAGQGLQEEVTIPHDHGGEGWSKGEAECGRATGRDVLRCVWELGLWSNLEGQVVPDPVECTASDERMEHNAQGAAANSCGSSSLG